MSQGIRIWHRVVVGVKMTLGNAVTLTVGILTLGSLYMTTDTILTWIMAILTLGLIKDIVLIISMTIDAILTLIMDILTLSIMLRAAGI